MSNMSIKIFNYGYALPEKRNKFKDFFKLCECADFKDMFNEVVYYELIELIYYHTLSDYIAIDGCESFWTIKAHSPDSPCNSCTISTPSVCDRCDKPGTKRLALLVSGTEGKVNMLCMDGLTDTKTHCNFLFGGSVEHINSASFGDLYKTDPRFMIYARNLIQLNTPKLEKFGHTSLAMAPKSFKLIAPQLTKAGSYCHPVIRRIIETNLEYKK